MDTFRILTELGRGFCIVGFWLLCIISALFAYALLVRYPQNKEEEQGALYIGAVLAAIWIGILIAVAGHFG